MRIFFLFMVARHDGWRRHPETNKNQHKRICAAYRAPAPRGFQVGQIKYLTSFTGLLVLLPGAADGKDIPGYDRLSGLL
jgi:hypothetical protein